MNSNSLSLMVLMLSFSNALCAQTDDRVAYLAPRPIARTADNHELGFRNGAVPGMVEFSMPIGTHRVDILNAKGNVIRSLALDEIASLHLGELAKGTWTLRAHTPEGLSIRRFVVMAPGKVAWAVPPVPKKR